MVARNHPPAGARTLNQPPHPSMAQRWVLLQTAPWGHVMSLPGHHLARFLTARGCRVAYLSAPVSPWHFLEPGARPLARRRWKAFGARGTWVRDGLFVHVPRTLFPLHHRPPFNGPLAAKAWLRTTFPSITAVLEENGFARPDVLLVQNLQFPGLEEALRPDRLVYTAEDDLGHFPRMPPLLPRLEEDIVPRAGLVTATARTLLGKMERLGARRLHYLPNGVDWEHYRGAGITGSRPAPPVAVYVGALDAWFDEELLAEVARLLPHWRFRLAGPPRRPFATLRALPNVEFIGPLPREEVPRLLHGATAGLVPFRRTPLTDSVCPLKLFEYMAAGLPTISTRMTEMENLASPARLCDNAEEFAAALRDAGEAGREERERLSLYARDFSWGRLFEGLLDALPPPGESP